MQVILTERVERLGNIGDVVRVKDGFARNFLLPRKKAIRATEPNLKAFEARRAELEKVNNERKEAATKILDKVQGANVNLIRQASEEGRLYGSVTARDISEAATRVTKQEIHPDMIVLNSKFKTIGIYEVIVILHPDVKASISLNIARSEEEAKVAVKREKEAAAPKEKKEKVSAKSSEDKSEEEVAE